ncbi:alanine dehydrogenase [Saccharopolyspora karakumensis]|uniref:Alanine dehydrogenase n=1 Tax=Saccharopolyspora karakumensis TaxID=2530386 RepID=A0A4R5B8K7_9PSEU|nr:alanine dehydrogenase [Saccharopolyspora karakumensis]TDD80034.1 alanine dehydrogenase [Saccharopolyspora karakumensis]
MLVGVPREIKNREFRVALTPSGVAELTNAGHDVVVEESAGVGSHMPDADYIAAGAKITTTAHEVWDSADLVLKVKEPVAAEYDRMREGQTLFTYLHLAASRECTEALLRRKITSIAYETVTAPEGTLPLLAPMSEVAGRLAPQVGAEAMRAGNGGRGMLLGGVPGVPPAHVVVIGGGVSGAAAAEIALGMRAQVTVLDRSLPRLRELDRALGGRVRTVASNALEIERAVLDADLVIGAVLVAGAKAPTLVSNDLVSRMKPGSVLVDIAIDQGGCFADSRPTTHDAPTYPVHDSVFYCVANMPGAVPNTSTLALTNATLPHVLALAGAGWRDALRQDAHLANGLNTWAGHITHDPVARAHGLPSVSLDEALS